MPYVFVYGTLKRGFRNHGVLGDSKLIGSYMTREPFTMYTGGFPVLTDPGVRPLPVKGELYEVSPVVLTTRLDALEGYPMMYTRRETPIQTEEGVRFAWVYLGNPQYWGNLEGRKLCEDHDFYEWRV